MSSLSLLCAFTESFAESFAIVTSVPCKVLSDVNMLTLTEPTGCVGRGLVLRRRCARACYRYTHSFPPPSVPFIVFTGALDHTAPATPMAVPIYESTRAVPRAIVNKHDATHHEPDILGYNKLLPQFSAAWMKLYLDGRQLLNFDMILERSLTHFSRISHAFLSSVAPLHAPRDGPCLVCPCSLGDDWCLRSDVISPIHVFRDSECLRHRL